MESLLTNRSLIAWLTGVSIATFLLSLAVVPILCIKMDPDYFLPERSAKNRFSNLHPLVGALLYISRNILGAFIFFAGILMLVLPGQGLLSMLAGLLMMDFPHKRRLELWLIRLPHVLPAINRLRALGKQPPLEVPPPKP